MKKIKVKVTNNTPLSLKERINQAIEDLLKKRKDVTIDIRVITDRIQIDIINLNTDETISFSATSKQEDWTDYVNYIQTARIEIMNKVEQYNMSVEILLVMMGWTRYNLSFA